MTLTELYLQEFDQEAGNTRKMLQRIPADKLAWRPHAKSMSLAGLATHLANVFSWMPMILEQPSLDLAPNGVALPHLKAAESVEEILQAFEQNAVRARAALAGADDEKLSQPWSLLMNSRVIFTQPRFAALRSSVMNHLIHHRAQLGLYLRLNDVAVPGMYGPSADETEM
ncbi:DUF664 domain-containing protein [bacterium]|nr:DUF664 domain-containing protein [bacterium]